MAVSPVPPVHPNCRCIIVSGFRITHAGDPLMIGEVMRAEDGWYDAQDARVCVYCMTLGASWNLRVELPLPEQEAEIDAILDKQGREQFRRAIERDSKVADAIIRDAAAVSDGGILNDLVPGITIETLTGGEALTVRIEREATRRLAEARAAAPIQPGRIVPGLGETTEGIIFEPTPSGRKRPTLVSVLVARIPTHRVIRRLGRYYVQTTGGRIVASDDNLGLILLILLALAERERQKREREERERRERGERERQ